MYKEEGEKMKDKYGREIDYLRISLTDKCNLRCAYCMEKDHNDFIQNDKLMTLEIGRAHV